MLITWPHAESDWRPILPEVEQVYEQVSRNVAAKQPLILICHNTDVEHAVRQRLQDDPHFDRIQFCVIPNNDTWIRDYGPLSVVCEEELEFQDWIFDGWGAKFPSHLDNAVNRQLAHLNVLPDNGLRPMPLVLEGGSIETNGEGLLLTTRRCLIKHNRNPGWTPDEIEDQLKTSLGIQRVLWLDYGYLDGDDTDGHIDTLVRFCDPTTVVYCQCADTGDSQYEELQLMASQLRQWASEFGWQLRALPLPAAKFDPVGNRLPLSYANFAIVNGAVLLPVFDDAADITAQHVLTECFPERDIIPIHSSVLFQQGGGLHCACMHIAAVN